MDAQSLDLKFGALTKIGTKIGRGQLFWADPDQAQRDLSNDTSFVKIGRFF